MAVLYKGFMDLYGTPAIVARSALRFLVGFSVFHPVSSVEHGVLLLFLLLLHSHHRNKHPVRLQNNDKDCKKQT